MNDYHAFPKQLSGGQYIAMLQLAHEAEARPLLQKGGRPQVFATKESCLQALMDHLLRVLRGHLVRDGEIAGQTAAEAQAAFKVVKQRARTRVITVAYKRWKASAKA